MGGGPAEEHMLIVRWDEEPKDLIDRFRTRFPYLKITYFRLDSNKPRLEEEGVPKELWKSVNILLTLGALPPTPDDAPNLRYIHLSSAGVDHLINHPILTDSKIPITTSSGIHGPPISEWVVMSMLVYSKHYNILHDQQKDHVWGTNDKHFAETRDHVGQRVGILGYGSIGRQVARVCKAMGMDVLAYTASPRTTPEARADDGYIIPNTGDPDGTIPVAWYSGTAPADLHAFLGQGLDHLVVALPLTPATTHLLGRDEFAVLARHGRRCFLSNISRGRIIDQPALVAALNGGLLRGAALDVADPEPLPPDDPLWDAQNAIVTPHISGVGVEYTARAFDVCYVNLERREAGRHLINEVDRRKGY